MKDTSCEHLRKRYQNLKGNRRIVEGVWDEIENYVLPFRGKFFKDDLTETDVEWRKRWIYDSVPVEAAQQLAASLNGSLTSPLVKWFHLRFRLHKLNADAGAKAWLEECEERCWFALTDSNFNLEANEAYLDLVGFGNAIITEEIEGTYEDFRGLDFKALPIKECYFEHNYAGQVKYFYRRVFLTPVQMVDKFGKDGVPKEYLDKAQDAADVDNKYECIFAIFERDEIIEQIKQKKIDPSLPLPPERRPYGYKWFLESSAEQLGDEGGYYDMPAFVVRWNKVASSKWGHGPAHTAMGDILTLNQMVQYILQAAEKVIDPPTLAENRGVIGDLDLSAGSLTIVRNIAAVRPYESAARFDVSQLQRNELRDSIRRMFFIDQLALKESPAMTATEVNIRYELMQRMLGPVLGRIQSDFLDPLVQRTFNILYRAGQLPEVPPAVAEAAAQMDIEYLGPLSRAQKADQVASIERFIGTMGGMAQFYPEVLLVIDPIKTAREQAQLLGVPQRIQRSDDEIDKKQKEQQAMAAQQQQMMQASQQAQVLDQFAGAGQKLKEVMGGQEAA